jgi:hypothetical protein
MENSPLELYEKAYRLHYVEHQIEDACRVYDQIIKTFPDSNECGYAAIQLQRIVAQEASGAGGPSSRKANALLLTISVVFNLITACGFAVVLILANQAWTSQRAYLTSLARASSLLALNRPADALSMLDSAKTFSGSDIIPYNISAQIYTALGDAEKARSELEAYKKRAPGAVATVATARAEAAPKTSAKEPPPSPAPSPSPSEEPAPPSPSPSAAPSPSPSSEPTAKDIESTFLKQPAKPTTRKAASSSKSSSRDTEKHLIVPKDSLQFF